MMGMHPAPESNVMGLIESIFRSHRLTGNALYRCIRAICDWIESTDSIQSHEIARKTNIECMRDNAKHSSEQLYPIRLFHLIGC